MEQKCDHKGHWINGGSGIINLAGDVMPKMIVYTNIICQNCGEMDVKSKLIRPDKLVTELAGLN